ncbi:hypothetical protein [uncultured Methanobrevibacter sp.]|uniref:hypothetical protein n=1 Tax=uncultured Methanobrevibacter sp. TaxID=253161 RepID=UPI0026385AC1|nr:hypothetical protein [uncultured Methanobrevibacter sp.]
MTNFDFLKGHNNELYEIGMKLEEDVISSPRAVTADATLFLETLVNDIYRLSKNKLERNLISFYKKIDNLYRLGIISYIYKNKLQDAYNLRNRIHKNVKSIEDEGKLAFDLHKRLYFIAKKYFRDFFDTNMDQDIPDYKKPEDKIISFDNCIICGCKNQSSQSNMCEECNRQIENANLLVGIRNSFEKSAFSKRDLMNYGLSESEVISLLVSLSRQNILLKKGDFYYINDDEFKKYLREIDEYIEIGLLITKFYKNEMDTQEIKETMAYWKGGINQKPYVEFYRLVRLKIERNFEDNLLKFENIKKSIKLSFMDDFNMKEWFENKKRDFLDGELNEGFILFNELLINDYFRYRKINMDEEKIKRKLHISDEIYDFWLNNFMSADFINKTTEIKKELLIKEIKRNKTLTEAISLSGMSEKEFNKIYYLSKKDDDEFYKRFDIEYTQKRQKTFLKHIRNNNLTKAIRISKITKGDFYKWYNPDEMDYFEFYIRTTEILMNQYLNYRIKGLSKNHVLKKMNIPKKMVKSWLMHDEFEIVRDFKQRNAEITSNLVKRGKIINALKDGKSKREAIRAANLTPQEFSMIYNNSKRENSNFHNRFDEEYVANRKKLLPKLLLSYDFYNAIQKCEITQKEFHKWYIKDQDRYISNENPTEFYRKTTELLMDKYIKSRKNGKNKPDSAKEVGLSNNFIDKWLNHSELALFNEFKKANEQMEIELVIDGFRQLKSKNEVSEIYDVSIKTIDEFIDRGKSGFVRFVEIFELYEDKVIPDLLDKFLDAFKNKPFNKAIKVSRISENELQYYYELGKSGDGKFKRFYESFLDLKLKLFSQAILAHKSGKIAFKNSCLSKEEYAENEKKIEKIVFDERFEIIIGEIEKNKTSGEKIARRLGVDVEDVYEWYEKGKNEDEIYEDFARIFETGVIIPRVMAYRHAMSMGISKNWLHKKLKKELGSKEYLIWDEYGFIDKEEMNHIKLDEVDKEEIKGILKNSEFIQCCFKKDDEDIYEFMKKAVKSNTKFVRKPNLISKAESPTISKSEIIGK